MNWLKTVIKNALREFLNEDSIDLARRSTEHIVLVPNHVNVLSIDCGQMPLIKSEIYLNKIRELILNQDPMCRLVLITKRS